MDLEAIQPRSKQQTQAEESRLLDSQARREAGWLRDGLRRAREKLTRKLEREQPLVKAKLDIEVAELHSSALSNGRTPPLTPQPSQSSQLPLKSTPAVPPHTPLPPVVQQVPTTGPQPKLHTTGTLTPASELQGPAPLIPKSVRLPSALALTLPPPQLTAQVITSTSQVALSFGSATPSSPVPAACTPVYRPPAEPLGAQSSAVYQPTGSSGQTTCEIARPSLPVFQRGRGSDLDELKLALDNLLGGDLCLSEQYKYQVLLGRIKLPNALQLAKSYMHDSTPYTSALQALKQKYEQPRHLVQAVLNAPALKMGDTSAFYSFTCSVQSLIGMLKTLEGQNGYELHCSSHVDCLLSKMPPTYRVDFIEYCLRDGILQGGADRTYTLQDLGTWLQMKCQAEQISSQVAALYQADNTRPAERDQQMAQPKEKPTDVCFKQAKKAAEERPTRVEPQQAKAKTKLRPYCPYCDRCEHYLNSCKEFRKLNAEKVSKWLKDGKRCQKCGRNHTEGWCTLRRPCKVCKEMHLTVLHESVQKTKWSCW